MYRRILLALTLLLAVALTACNTATPGVSTVEVVGGDRSLEPGELTLLSALVVASTGIDTNVTWSVDDVSVATISADGALVAQDVGSTTVTATSVADTNKSDSIAVTVAVDPANPEKVDATLLLPSGADPVLGVALYFQAAMPTITAATLTEVMEGLYFGPVGSVAADGSAELLMPDTADVPSELLRTATSFVPMVEDFADCSLTASDASVGVTNGDFLFSGLTSGVAVLAASGAEPAYPINAPIDPDTFTEEELLSVGHTIWVYAEGAVTVETTGAGCTSGTKDLNVDVALEAGWNQLTWDMEFDEIDITSFTLRNSDGEPVYIIASPIF